MMITPLAFLFAYFGVFGQRVAHAAHPELTILTDKGRREYPITVIRHYTIWIVAVCLLMAGLWYFLAK
jgi:hypothetical protein